jgi:hypothetical protein
VLQRACACATRAAAVVRSGESEEPGPPLRRRALGRTALQEVPASVHATLATPGMPLGREERDYLEPRFGIDLSHVRVHADAAAAASANAVDARAYAVGEHVVFAQHQYAPSTAGGIGLLVHELAHVMQQPRYQGGAPLRVDDSLESNADAVAQTVLSGQAAPARAAATQPLVARQALPVPVRPPMPVRPPLRSIPGGRTDPGGRPLPSAERGPRYAPDPFDDSFEAMLERANIRDYAERQRLQAERPVATLNRGGAAPSFISEAGQRRVEWLVGPGGGGSVMARIRRYHVLDAIESEVNRSNTEADLEDVLEAHVPLVALLNRGIETSRSGRGSTRDLLWRPPLRLRPFWEEPIYPADFDPQAVVRLEVFETAARRRAQTVPALANSRLIPQRRRRGGCRIEPIAPMGGDPLSTLYCHLATGSPYSYRITIESASGAATRRWAEIDSLRGNTWYECKCGYEALLSGAARGDRVADAVLDKLTRQVLNHVDIARTCGLEYRYIVSNAHVRDLLQSRWFGNVVIDVVPFESCD